MCVSFQVPDNHVIKYTPPENLNESLQKKLRRRIEMGSLVVGADPIDPRLVSPAALLWRVVVFFVHIYSPFYN